MKTKQLIYSREVELLGDLHARPAADVIAVASRFAATIELRKKGDPRPFNAKSILGVIGFGARRGEEVSVRAYGASDAEQAADGVALALVEAAV